MRTVKTVLIEKELVDSIKCNMCGHEIEKHCNEHIDQHINIEKSWGYGSPHDGETHSIDLCLDCYEKLMDMMKIPPIEK